MNLEEIINNIPYREEWQERYHYFIPLFISNAIKFNNWQDWDPDVFAEFFERNEGQCVSSLKQGCFTNEDKIKLKQNWKQFSILLKELALSQDEPDWDLYKRTSNFIRQYTLQNMQAATNRLIASLQPQLLCTIITEEHLKVLYNKLNFVKVEISIPKYENGDWFRSSYNILKYFKEQLNDNDNYNIMTYPWQLKEEWMPKGYNKFYDILNEVKELLDSELSPFKIEKINPNLSNYVWISDKYNIIGNTIAHFEIFKKYNDIWIDIHFEDERTKGLFIIYLKALPEKLIWKDWHNSKSISYFETYKLNDPDIARKIVNALYYIEQSIGDQIRYILENLNTILHHNQINRKKMNKIIKLLVYKKQIILQGPPGTGKTREAKLIAKEILGLDSIEDLKENEQFKIIQFHPSYTYEDFVRGIIVTTDDGVPEYKTLNKIVGDFARKANQSNLTGGVDDFQRAWSQLVEDINENKVTKIGTSTVKVEINSQGNIKFVSPVATFEKTYELYKFGKTDLKYETYQKIVLNYLKNPQGSYKLKDYCAPQETQSDKPYVLVIDEINRANLSSVLGELIYALEYRGHTVESIYSTLEDGHFLILPNNLYIIGTMNTADRSVGHIDYAIRRRFAFVEVLPNVLEDNTIVFNKELFEKVSILFINNYNEYFEDIERKVILQPAKTLSSEFRPEDVWLGHSYFIQKKLEDNKLEPEDFRIKIDYEIKPILMEYVKDGVLVGRVGEQEIEDYINNL